MSNTYNTICSNSYIQNCKVFTTFGCNDNVIRILFVARIIIEKWEICKSFVNNENYLTKS